MSYSTNREPRTSRRLGSLVSCLAVLMLSNGCAKTPVQTLIQELSHSDVEKRYDAAKQLESLGPEAKEATTALAKLLRDPEGKLRYRAAKAISKIGAEAVEATPALIESLDDKNPEVIYYAAKALAKIGQPAQASGPALAKTLDSQSDPKLRRVLSKAIYEVETTSTKVVPSLTKAMSDEDADVCYYAVMAMSRLGKSAKSAVPTVRALAQRGDARVKEAAESALERIR